MAGKDWTVCLPNEKEKKKKKRDKERKTKDERRDLEFKKGFSNF
jgi:hypothetical protein